MNIFNTVFNKEIHCLRNISPADIGFYAASATIAAYIIIAVVLKITVPLWIHWAMGLVFIVLFVTGQNMPEYDEKTRKLKEEEKEHLKKGDFK